MIPKCHLVYPYFENPRMLERQVTNWNRMSGDLRKQVHVVLVDDCSQKHPAEPIFANLELSHKSLYRFTERGIWGMHEARNLGAMQPIYELENGKEPLPPLWLLMSDIDLIITPEMLYTLLSKDLDYKYHYTFERRMMPDLRDHRYHCNSYLLNHKAYFAINGYDVDFTGTFGGGYGGDGEFARQLGGITPRRHLSDIYLIGYERDVVEDANTTHWDREEWKKKYREVFDRKRKRGDLRSVNPIRRKWEKVNVS